MVVAALVLIVVHGVADAAHDALWLRYTEVPAATRVSLYGEIERADVAVVADPNDDPKLDPTRGVVLDAVRDELTAGIDAMLPAAGAPPARARLLVNVNVSSRAFSRAVGAEGYRLRGATIEAATASGAFYGAFALLGLVQRREPLPAVATTSVPATRLRHWDLWDELDGSVTRGYAGRSLFWPMALFDDDAAPPMDQVYLAACDAADARQRWSGATLRNGVFDNVEIKMFRIRSTWPMNRCGERDHPDLEISSRDQWLFSTQVFDPSPITNEATGGCLTTASCRPTLALAPCDATTWRYNATNKTFVVARAAANQTCGTHGGVGNCLDINGGSGPDVGMYRCHTTDEGDYRHQQFIVEGETIRSARDNKACLGVSRPNPPWEGAADPWVPGGAYKRRVADALRALKSAGLNGVVLLDVNACGATQTQSLATGPLQRIAKNLRPLFERYAMTPFYSACFAAPTELDGVDADPASPAARAWWKAKAAEIYAEDAWGPRFGGFLVKADSEGNVGPARFGRTQADGANMLADAVRASSNASWVIWRAFVYGTDDAVGQEDLARHCVRNS